MEGKREKRLNRKPGKNRDKQIDNQCQNGIK